MDSGDLIGQQAISSVNTEPAPQIQAPPHVPLNSEGEGVGVSRQLFASGGNHGEGNHGDEPAGEEMPVLLREKTHLFQCGVEGEQRQVSTVGW